MKLLQVAVIHETMTPAGAAGQLAKLLRPDLPLSQRIALRETTKAAFEAGDDVVEKIKPFLKGASQQQARNTSKSKDSRLHSVKFVIIHSRMNRGCLALAGLGLLSLLVFGVTLEALNDPKELSAIPFKPWDSSPTG